MDKMVKWVLIAGGVYLLYRYWQSTQVQQIQEGVLPAATGATLPAVVPATIVPSMDTTTLPVTVASHITGQELGTYARTYEGEAWDGLLNSDQWSYYLGSKNGAPVAATADLFPAGNRDYRMNADEYVQRRLDAGGFSGLGSLPQVARLAQAFGTLANGWTV